MFVRTAAVVLIGLSWATARGDTVSIELAATTSSADSFVVESLQFDDAATGVAVDDPVTSATDLFDPAPIGSIKIPNTTIEPAGLRTSVSLDGSYEGAAALQGVLPAPAGAPTPVPLPAAAWAGLALIGGVAMTKLRRRPQPIA